MGTEQVAGVSAITTTPAGAPEGKNRRRKKIVEWVGSGLLVFCAVALGAYMGYDYRGRQMPYFAQQSHQSVDDVLQSLREMGVTCNTPLERHEYRSKNGRSAICTDQRFFEVDESESVSANIEHVEAMYSLGCVNKPNEFHKQWYVAHDANWFMFTYDLDLASRASNIRGVVVTTGRCFREATIVTPQ